MKLFLPLRHLGYLVLCLTSLISLESTAQTHIARHFSITSNSGGFYEYLPRNYHAENGTYPLIVFIHGVGELGNGSGSQLRTVLDQGLPKLIRDGNFPVSFTVNGESFKFIVISPQFINWPSPGDVKGVIDYAVQNYRVNTSRIYVTGMSMGGGATWDYAGENATNANRLAAIVPVCGASGAVDERVNVLTRAALPIWALHNQGDDVVPVSNTIEYVDKILNLNFILNLFSPPVAKKTIFQVNSHDAWSTSYNPDYKENNKNIYEWMLQYTRGNAPSNPSPSPAPNQNPSANAGSDQTLTLPNNSITLSGSGSDQDGSIEHYEWSYVSGPSQYNINYTNISYPTISNLTQGTYTFRLTVRDNAGATASDEININVNSGAAAPAPPPMNFGSTFTIPGMVEAEMYNNMYGVATENTSDQGGGRDVGWIDNGDWMDYNVNVTASGNYTVYFRVASPYSGQQFQLKSSNGNVITTINLPQTGGFQNWEMVTATVYLPAGSQTIRLISTQSGNWNINYMEFLSTSSSAPLPGFQSIPGRIEAENYSSMSGVLPEITADNGGGSNVGWIEYGDWMKYNVNVASSVNYVARFRVATPFNGQQLLVKNSSGTVIATVNIPNTGYFQNWTTVSVPLFLFAGNQTISIESSRNGYFNINWMQFESGQQTQGNSVESGTLAGSELIPSTEQSFSIYPNPVDKSFTMLVKNNYTGNMNVQVVNLAGIVVKQYKFTKGTAVSQLNLSVGELPSGTYLIKLQIGKWTDTKKLFKK